MKKNVLLTRGGTAMVTVCQVGQALAGAIERRMCTFWPRQLRRRGYAGMAGNEPPQHREWSCTLAQGIEIKELDGLQKGEMLGASPFFYMLRDFMAVRHRRIQWSCCFCRDEMEEKPVKLSLAPMEGITGPVFRKAHASCFGALDSCYLPFIAPAHPGKAFTEKTLKALGKQDGRSVIPQLLTKDADDFVWTAGLLAELGYSEVNLNLGCPSGTVVAKGKGAGLLRDAEGLERFLQDICARSPLPVSVKTRLGLADVGEYGRILAVLCRCPLKELIVHPRVRTELYRGTPHLSCYGETLEKAPFPVAYSGDIFSVADFEELLRSYPATTHALLGRGILANPALGRMLKGGPAATAEEIREFHDRLFEGYEEEMGGNALFRMKEWWSYARFAFADPQKVWRLVRKVRKADEYEKAVERIFNGVELADEAVYRP